MADRQKEIEVCDFVREIISARTGEPITPTEHPDQERRDVPAVEQLWESPSHRYAVEHTRVEAFERQLRNEATVDRLLTPIRTVFFQNIPGDFQIVVREADTSRLPLAQYEAVRVEIAKLIHQAAQTLDVGATVKLESPGLPFPVRLVRRDGPARQLLIKTLIVAPESARLERFQWAMAKKLPKLASWSADGRRSVLVLESRDGQHSDVWLAYDATRAALADRTDVPHTIVLVETDSGSWYGWMLKEGDAWGDKVARVNGVGFYTRWQVAGLPRHGSSGV